MSRLVCTNPGSKLEPGPEGFKFGEFKVDDEEINKVEVKGEMKASTGEKLHGDKLKITVKEDDEGLIPEIQLVWNMPDKHIAKIQRQYGFCMKIIEEVQNRKRKTFHKYHIHGGLLLRYNTDYKQRF